MRYKPPSSWQKLAFKDAAEVITGSTPSTKEPENYGEYLPFVTPGELDLGEPIIHAETSLSLVGKAKARTVPKDSVLVCCIGSLGKVGITGREVAFNQQINALVFNEKLVCPRYGYHYCRTLKPLLSHMAPSTTVAIVNKSRFQSLEIPLPPLEEQRRIAAILDKADGVRRKCKEAIRLTEELLRSTFLEMFGDPVTNPKGWEIVKIENIIELVSGQVDPRESPYSNMLHVGGDNIESGTGEISGCKTPAELSLISGKYLFRKGDILYSKIRPYLNKVSLPDFDGVCSADIYPIRVNHSCVTPIYMTSILRSKGFLEYAEKHSTRTNIPKINRKALLSFECPLPPLGLQNQFTNSANKILKIKDHEKTGVDKANNLFNSLLQRAFRGEL
jgi:type I restriction enzyme S subunit